MKKIFYTFLISISCMQITLAQTTAWNFTTNTEGWLPANSITGSVSNGIYTLNITGSDPFMMSPANLNLDAGSFFQVNFLIQNKTADPDFRLYFITSNDPNWNDAKSIGFKVNTNQTAYTNVEVVMVKNTAWKGMVKQIRLDPGNGLVLGQVLIDQISFSLMDFGIDNGIIHLKQDLTRGGAISYISKSGTTRSLVNISDEGRYIQQSYYAGKTINRITEGQSPDWSPWSWNPIQVGDYARNRAQILDYQKGTDNLYVKCIPMLWDMKKMAAEAEMEQWSTLIGNRIHVKCRLTCHRTDNLYDEGVMNGQEYPAVYPISALKNLYTYTGNSPYTNAPVENPAVVNLSSGFWGVYPNVSEHWMAFLDDTKWGMGIYNANCIQWLAGMAGKPGYEALDSSTSYIAPSGQTIINKNSVVEYEYDIVIGSLQEIRETAYNLYQANQPEVSYKYVIPIPGTVEAEDYNKGGQGLAYWDLDTANNGNTYRADGVDIAIAGASTYVGWTNVGEWSNYFVNVAQTGDYKMSANLASPFATGKFQVCIDGKNIAPAGQPVTRVILMGGQSNMVGVGINADFPSELQQTQTNVQIYYDGHQSLPYWQNLRLGLGAIPEWSGPELSFGRDMALAYPNDKIALIKVCWGATALATDWRPPTSGGTVGNLYDTFIKNVNAALSSINNFGNPVQIAGMLWMQGESDACDLTQTNEYQSNLTNFIKDVRKDLNVPNMPFVIAKIDVQPGWPYNAIVRLAEEKVAETVPQTTIFDTKGIPTDKVHYTAAGLVQLGTEFATSLNSIMSASSYFTVPNTGSMATFQLKELSTLNLTKGEHKLTFLVDAAGFNIDYLKFELQTTDVMVQVKDAEILVYPNPARDEIVIKALRQQGTETSSKLQIMDMHGQVVLTSDFRLRSSAFTLNISSLTPGLYFIKLINQQKTYTQKFIKQ